jgi:hypothetical protein
MMYLRKVIVEHVSRSGAHMRRRDEIAVYHTMHHALIMADSLPLLLSAIL